MFSKHKNNMNLRRYERHIALHDFSGEDHKKLLESKAIVIGLGGVGVQVVANLAGLGVNLGICDDDNIEESNLNRQFIYKESDINKMKADVCEKWIQAYNSDIEVIKHRNVASINFNEYDVVIDCTDNIDSRIKISKISKKSRIPLIYASAVAYISRVGTFCKKYLHEIAVIKGESSCESAGIFPPAAGVAGCIAASECVKILLEKCMCDKMIINNLESNAQKVIKI